ncbi:ABC transporter permease [Streptomyces sp. Tu 3180]|uniref:ABC transporter permease n=1 Tax=Streptomyces sp. Tu 3180 TaxID=2682611 RepID=UPI0013584972|nr:ABC transporter permease [Streptomyces sp. Tu 3180]KAF3466185.1 ABC transporter permease [Streptomyces sp. Tu 3180]
MTTVTTVTPAPAAATAAPRASWAAVFALARSEARLLLLRAPVLIAFAVYAGWTVWRTRTSWDGFPALQDADRATQNGPLLVGLAVLLCANHAVLRSRRYGTEQHFAVLVVPPWRRTVAHLLSVVPAALLVAACVGGQFAWEALKPGAVGHGSPGELLVGPLSVLLSGAFGVLLARLVASSLAAPLLIVLLLFSFLFVAVPTDDGWTRWLAPAVGEHSGLTLPSGLLGRPAAWHALYLAGLALTAALVAVLVSGGARLWAVRAGAAGAVALTLVGAVAQSRGVPPETAEARTRISVAPEKEQRCAERAGATYCAFPEWTPRTGDWAEAVESVRALAGGTAQDRPLVVRQRIEARYGLSGDAALPALTRPGEVTVGTAWGGNRVPEFSVAVAGVLVTGEEQEVGLMCDGRMVTVMWLALAGRPDPMSDLRRVRLDDSVSGSAVVISQTEPLNMTAAHTELVRELLERPRDQVAAKVRAHWDELTAPKVTAGRVADLLGLDAPEEADECL